MLTCNGNQALEIIEIYETNTEKQIRVSRGTHNSEQYKLLDDKVT